MNNNINETAAVPAATPRELAATKTFWAMVFRRFYSRKLNKAARWWIILLILMAIFVPFLANDAPYTAIIQGRREFPLFKNLTKVDWMIFSSTLCAAIYLLAARYYNRRCENIEELHYKKSLWLISMLLAGGVMLAGIGGLKHDYLDRRDYHVLAQKKELTAAVFAPLKWGYKDQEPLDQDRTFERPSRDHWLGTDGNGRDALARLLWSTRVVMAIGFISEIIALCIGVIWGAVNGYFMGKVDIIGMRLVEVVEAIPTLFLLITFVALYGRNVAMLMAIIGLTSWTGIARYVRAEFLRIRRLDYVAAAKAAGLPLPSILFRHMLPNGLTPVIVSFTFGVAGAVGSESVLSFLGIGVEPPTPSWGSMLNEAGNPSETFRWWLAIAPGLLIFLTVFAYNIIGEGLQDAIDPRKKN